MFMACTSHVVAMGRVRGAAVAITIFNNHLLHRTPITPIGAHFRAKKNTRSRQADMQNSICCKKFNILAIRDTAPQELS